MVGVLTTLRLNVVWIPHCFVELLHQHVEVRFWTNLRNFPRYSFPVYKSPLSHSLNRSKRLRRSCLRKLRLVFQNRGYVSKCRDISLSQQHCLQGPHFHSTQNVPRLALLSKCHTLSRYMRKCYFVYGRKKSAAFSAPISMQMSIAQ